MADKAGMTAAFLAGGAAVAAVGSAALCAASGFSHPKPAVAEAKEKAPAAAAAPSSSAPTREMAGRLYNFTSDSTPWNLQAFESGPATGGRFLVIMGGLTDGLLATAYTPRMAAAAAVRAVSVGADVTGVVHLASSCLSGPVSS
jgi:hypothetical protein